MPIACITYIGSASFVMGAAQQKDSIVRMVHAYRTENIIPLLVQCSSICICISHLEQLFIFHLQQTVQNQWNVWKKLLHGLNICSNCYLHSATKLDHIFFLERAGELRIIILREERSKVDRNTTPRGQKRKNKKNRPRPNPQASTPALPQGGSLTGPTRPYLKWQ